MLKLTTIAFIANAIILQLPTVECIAQDNGNTTTESVETIRTPNVAVIDIDYILRNHIRLDRGLADLLSEAEEFTEQMSKEQISIDKRRQSLQQYKIDIPEHQRISQEVAKAEGALQASTQAKRNFFRRRESRLYYGAYREVVAAVEAFADRHGIGLVLSYDSEWPDTNSPDDIEHAINSRVVFQKKRSITFQILEVINRDVTAEEKAKPSVFLRPIEELRATGLQFPYYRKPDLLSDRDSQR